MKNFFNILFLFCLSITAVHAQKTIQGTVEYSYTITGENAEMMAGMMPSKMVVVYGDDAMMTYMEGGMMANMMGKVIVNKGESYVVKEDTKTVYEMSEEDRKNAEEQQKAQTGEVQKVEGQTKEVLGYSCQLYNVEINQNGQKATQKVWVTNDLKAPDLSGAGTSAMNQGIMANLDVPGFPMEVEVMIPQTNMTMVLAVSDIKMDKPSDDTFKKPSDYTVKPFADMMKMGGN